MNIQDFHLQLPVLKALVVTQIKSTYNTSVKAVYDVIRANTEYRRFEQCIFYSVLFI